MRPRQAVDRLELWRNYSAAKAAAMGVTWRTEGLTVEIGRRMVSALRDFVPPHSKADVLDIGCGTGEVTLMVADAGYRVAGLDISENLAAEFRRNAAHLGIEFIAGDVMSLPSERRFDAAISRFVFTHYSDFRKLLAAMARFVRPGGVIVFDSLSDESVYYASSVTGRSAEEIMEKCYDPLPSFSDEDIRVFCAENSWTLERRAPLDFLHRNPILAMTYDSQAETDAFLKSRYENDDVRSFLNWLNSNISSGLDSRFAGLLVNVVRVN